MINLRVGELVVKIGLYDQVLINKLVSKSCQGHKTFLKRNEQCILYE